MSDTVLMDISKRVRSAEVFTGSGRRRRWSAEEKAVDRGRELRVGRHGVWCRPAPWADAAPVVCVAPRVSQPLGTNEDKAASLYVPAMVEATVPASAP